MIEQPGTDDPLRASKGGLYGPHFQTYNRNKRSVQMNVNDHQGRDKLYELVKDADVYIQNFRPGVADQHSLGADKLRSINPRLIYCSISGLGSTGPAADRAAFDTVAQAASGYLNLLINPENPRVVGSAIADSVTGFDDPRFSNRDSRIAHQQELIEFMSPISAERTRTEWCERLLAEDVPHARVCDSSDALEDPQARHLQLLVESTHPTMGTHKTVRPPAS